MRNSFSRLLCWNCKLINGIVDPLILKNLACKEDFFLIFLRGCSDIIIEIDFLTVIQAISDHIFFSFHIEGLIRMFLILWLPFLLSPLNMCTERVIYCPFSCIKSHSWSFLLFYFNSSRCFCTWLCSSLILMLLFIIKIENYREKCSTLIINLMKKFQKEVHGSLLVHVSWNGSADSRFRTPLSWTPPPFPVNSQSQWLRLWPPRPLPLPGWPRLLKPFFLSEACQNLKGNLHGNKLN